MTYDIEFGDTQVLPITRRGVVFIENTPEGNVSSPVNYNRATRAGLQVSFTTAAVRDWVTVARRNSR